MHQADNFLLTGPEGLAFGCLFFTYSIEEPERYRPYDKDRTVNRNE